MHDRIQGEAAYGVALKSDGWGSQFFSVHRVISTSGFGGHNFWVQRCPGHVGSAWMCVGHELKIRDSSWHSHPQIFPFKSLFPLPGYSPPIWVPVVTSFALGVDLCVTKVSSWSAAMKTVAAFHKAAHVHLYKYCTRIKNTHHFQVFRRQIKMVTRVGTVALHTVRSIPDDCLHWGNIKEAMENWVDAGSDSFNMSKSLMGSNFFTPPNLLPILFFCRYVTSFVLRTLGLTLLP